MRFGTTKSSDMITDEEFVEKEIRAFLASKRRKNILDGERYFEGNHDILKRKRTAIGEGGEIEEIKNLPNTKIVDNQYKKMVVQKNNYLLGQPISFRTENDDYSKVLTEYFNKKFQRLMRNIGEDSLNFGIGWVFIGIDEEGQLEFKRFNATEIIPGWKDRDHTELEYAIRVYEVKAYIGSEEKTVTKVEVYDGNGIHYFELDNDNKLVAVEPFHSSYFSFGENHFNWQRIPLIPFRYNAREIPLICEVKCLQDGLNLMMSELLNRMEEDVRNTILVLKNYDGENLGKFRKNLAVYGAVKVRTIDGADGDVKTLQVEVNSENYKAVLEALKKSIIENAMGYDAKDDRLAGNPNQMNIQSMYSDIDLDANGTETEYQAAFEELLWFINSYLANTGQGDFEGEKVEVIFNRDILISEGTVIENCQKSMGILSEETIVANHPWVDDPQAELEKLKKQRSEGVEQYENAFESPKAEGEEDE